MPTASVPQPPAVRPNAVSAETSPSQNVPDPGGRTEVSRLSSSRLRAVARVARASEVSRRRRSRGMVRSVSARTMVLCAGFGTRLRPLTDERPKPLVPIGDRTLLEHVLAGLERQGVLPAVANAHHLSEIFRVMTRGWPTDCSRASRTQDPRHGGRRRLGARPARPAAGARRQRRRARELRRARGAREDTRRRDLPGARAAPPSGGQRRHRRRTVAW